MFLENLDNLALHHINKYKYFKIENFILNCNDISQY